MEAIQSFVDALGGIVWGPYVLLPLLVGTGLYLTLGLKFMPWRYVFPAFKHMLAGRKSNDAHQGELTPFKAMMTCMAATIGTGNIVGVSTAIMIGGPGAVFWMWLTALLGMATKYSEALLAVKYREVTPTATMWAARCSISKTALAKSGSGWPGSSPCSAWWPVSASAT